MCEATTGAGDCSLRGAVMEANATPEPTSVRIVLASDAEYVLTRVADCGISPAADSSVDDLDLGRSVQIIGQGATIRTDGGEAEHPVYGSVSCDFRVFENHHGHLAVEDLTIDADTYDRGAVLLNRSTAQLTDVVATGTGYGGGVVLHNLGSLTLVRTHVVGGGTFGFPDESRPWAGVWSEGGSLVLLDSRIQGNAGLSRYGSADFAGIHVASGDATIIQSLVTGHRGFLVGPGGGGVVHGDGIDARAPLQIVRSTVVDNGTGRDVAGDAAVEVSGSILGSCTRVVASLGHSSDADGSCLGAGHATDLVATPTVFAGPLAAQPWLPVAGAPVLDAIPPGTSTLCDVVWPTDLRGAPRSSGAGCDIGALERQPTDP